MEMGANKTLCLTLRCLFSVWTGLLVSGCVTTDLALVAYQEMGQEKSGLAASSFSEIESVGTHDRLVVFRLTYRNTTNYIPDIKLHQDHDPKKSIRRVTLSSSAENANFLVLASIKESTDDKLSLSTSIDTCSQKIGCTSTMGGPGNKYIANLGPPGSVTYIGSLTFLVEDQFPERGKKFGYQPMIKSAQLTNHEARDVPIAKESWPALTSRKLYISPAVVQCNILQDLFPGKYR
jgi:hypothetical protein